MSRTLLAFFMAILLVTTITALKINEEHTLANDNAKATAATKV